MAANIYTHIISDSTKPTQGQERYIQNTWKNIQHTKTTDSRRNTLHTTLDRFSTFMWRGIDAWQVFGAFIVADKRGDLKFYNGANFSNEYSSSQFSDLGNNLLGVSIKQQTIQFKIGMYWFNMEDYRKFLNWLDPYVVNYLSFGFNSDYGYLVKLGSIADSPKYIVGYEDNEPQYYTELTLNWQVQGPACARHLHPWSFTLPGSGQFPFMEFHPDTEHTEPSELDTPLIAQIPLTTFRSNLHVKLIMKYETTLEQTLFDVYLENLTYNLDNNINDPINLGDDQRDPVLNNMYNLTLRYDSETGLLFLMLGDSIYKILNLLTTTTDGLNMVKSLEVRKFYIPGILTTDYNWENIYFELVVEDYTNNGALVVDWLDEPLSILRVRQGGGADQVLVANIQASNIITTYSRRKIA